MPDEHSHLLAGLQAEVSRMWADGRRMVTSRWELVQLELVAAANSIRRLLLILIPAALVTVLSLPLFVVALATALDGRLGLPSWGWLLIFGLTFVVSAFTAVMLAYRRFRRDFRGLEETIEELREDMAWLREWTGKPRDSD